MATVELTGQNFESVVGGADMVLVDFWASWCGPCRMFAPVFDRASEKHSDAVFGKVDTDAETVLAQQFNISSIPTLMLSLITISVGMDEILNCWASTVSASVSTLPNTASECFSDARSKTGANMRHGPHQEAQKSTRTMSAPPTTDSKF